MIGIIKIIEETTREITNPPMPIPCDARIDVYVIERLIVPEECARLVVCLIS